MKRDAENEKGPPLSEAGPISLTVIGVPACTVRRSYHISESRQSKFPCSNILAEREGGDEPSLGAVTRALCDDRKTRASHESVFWATSEVTGDSHL
jgi:hypothetical protein